MKIIRIYDAGELTLEHDFEIPAGHALFFRFTAF
jgi:hypothetical protein